MYRVYILVSWSMLVFGDSVLILKMSFPQFEKPIMFMGLINYWIFPVFEVISWKKQYKFICIDSLLAINHVHLSRHLSSSIFHHFIVKHDFFISWAACHCIWIQINKYLSALFEWSSSHMYSCWWSLSCLIREAASCNRFVSFMKPVCLFLTYDVFCIVCTLIKFSLDVAMFCVCVHCVLSHLQVLQVLKSCVLECFVYATFVNVCLHGQTC